MEFGKGTGFMFNKYVNLVLNTMTGNEHEKYLKYIKDRQDAASATTSTSTTTLVKSEQQSNENNIEKPANDSDEALVKVETKN